MEGLTSMFGTLPGAVQTALTTLQQAGIQAVLVGGCVRDALMGVPPHDFDIAAGAPPAVLKDVFSAFPLILDGEKHGTVTPGIDHTPVEITSFRTEAATRTGAIPTKSPLPPPWKTTSCGGISRSTPWPGARTKD